MADKLPEFKDHFKDKSIGELMKELHMTTKETSDGSTASYYELPAGATELQDLISHCDMNAQIGEIFRAAYRYGRASHSDKIRDAKKIKFYIEAEIERLQKLAESQAANSSMQFQS